MRKDDARILDVVLAAREALSYSAGASREQYLQDRKLQSALCMQLEIIGEASRVISDEFKKSHPEIPWKDIVGLRNRIVHEYFRLDRDIIWEIVQRDLPSLLKLMTPLVPPADKS